MEVFTQNYRLHFYFIVTLIFLGGCGTTSINPNHPQITNSKTSETAKVYFLREDIGFSGVGDIAFTIYLQDQELLTLAKGEYTLIHLKDFTGYLSVEAHTVSMGRGSWSKVKETQSFTFKGGRTYCISFRENFNPEANGWSYLPILINEYTAIKITKSLKAVGEAVNYPL